MVLLTNSASSVWFTSDVSYPSCHRLVGNPICQQGDNRKYCTATGQANPEMPPYATAKNCSSLPPPCLSYQMLSPACICAVPTCRTRAPYSSDRRRFLTWATARTSSVESKKWRANSWNAASRWTRSRSMIQFLMRTTTCRWAWSCFQVARPGSVNKTFLTSGSCLSNQTYKPTGYGPYFFIGQAYTFANGEIIHVYIQIQGL